MPDIPHANRSRDFCHVVVVCLHLFGVLLLNQIQIQNPKPPMPGAMPVEFYSSPDGLNLCLSLDEALWLKGSATATWVTSLTSTAPWLSAVNESLNRSACSTRLPQCSAAWTLQCPSCFANLKKVNLTPSKQFTFFIQMRAFKSTNGSCHGCPADKSKLTTGLVWRNQALWSNWAPQNVSTSPDLPGHQLGLASIVRRCRLPTMHLHQRLRRCPQEVEPKPLDTLKVLHLGLPQQLFAKEVQVLASLLPSPLRLSQANEAMPLLPLVIAAFLAQQAVSAHATFLQLLHGERPFVLHRTNSAAQRLREMREASLKHGNHKRSNDKQKRRTTAPNQINVPCIGALKFRTLADQS